MLLDCLGPLGQVARRRAVIEELGRRIERYQAEAKAELALREEQKAREPAPPAPRPDNEQMRIQFEERRLRELSYGRPLLLEWFLASQALLEKQPAEARRQLKKLYEAGLSNGGISQRVAGALVELGDLESAHALLQKALEADPENAQVHAQLAGIHLRARRFDDAIAAATESLSLVYFQPGVHAVLGKALMGIKRFAESEKELLVAVAQSPRNLAAHRLLGRLYRQHLDRPADAFAHEGRALSLRHELAARRRAGLSGTGVVQAPHPAPSVTPKPAVVKNGLPEPFVPEIDPRKIITVVSGLPRSGTSMMMQLLVAAGREALTDAKRAADEDNPLGYLEFERAMHLAKDVSWLPQARGKVVKIVAQLLPFLPAGEHYHIILMERDLSEVIASQNAMLARQGRPGAQLEVQRLLDTYTAQLQRVRSQLARRREIRTLSVDYGELLADTVTGIERLAQFLAVPFNCQAARNTVRPELRRQKT